MKVTIEITDEARKIIYYNWCKVEVLLPEKETEWFVNQIVNNQIMGYDDENELFLRAKKTA